MDDGLDVKAIFGNTWLDDRIISLNSYDSECEIIMFETDTILERKA